MARNNVLSRYEEIEQGKWQKHSYNYFWSFSHYFIHVQLQNMHFIITKKLDDYIDLLLN